LKIGLLHQPLEFSAALKEQGHLCAEKIATVRFTHSLKTNST
jgi:hypothetical protein